MSEIKQIVTDLREANIRLVLKGENIEIKAPKSALTPEIIGRIKANKDGLISYLKASEENEENAFSSIPKIAVNDQYKLSSAQHRIWVLSQFEEGNLSFNIPRVLSFDEGNNEDLLIQAIAKTVERHDILRTLFFQDEEGEVWQKIVAPEKFDLQITFKDLSAEENSQDIVDNYVKADNQLAFDLEKGPLFRGVLFKVAEGKFTFYFNTHHIICDGWSMDILMRDVFTFYQALVEQKEAQLPALPIQYVDYAHWQLGQFKEAKENPSKNYWLNRFSGELPILDLVNTTNRPLVRTFNGETLETFLSKELTKKLNDLCMAFNGSLFMGLMSATLATFYRYTGQDDLILGTPVSGREHPDLEHQIGCYLNILALRNQIEPKDSLKTLFKRVQRTILEGYQYQAYPFDLLIQELELKRDTSRNALLDVLITLQNTGEKSTSPNITNEQESSVRKVADHGNKFDLDLVFEEVGDLISFKINYNSDVYTKEVVSRFMIHFRNLLSEMLTNQEREIQTLNYLGAGEENKLLNEFNDTTCVITNGHTIAEVFEKQVADTPDKTALVFQNKELTYAELNSRVNQLAHFLNSNYTVKENELIGIKLERSNELIVAMLAILKLGAAYLPLDVNFPADRLEYMIADSDCKIIIDQEIIQSHLIGESKTENPNVKIDESHLAYTIYTSGTTGNPKGVQVTHENVINFFAGMDQKIERDEDQETFLAVTTFSFDISVLELLWTLCRGMKVVINPAQKQVAKTSKMTNPSNRKMDFGLFYFASAGDNNGTYNQLLEGAKYGDEHGFSAIWTPERHFHEFGGIYPNPSVIGAGIATITKNIGIRAGSCVLPLHNPIRVTEEWSVVDNLSNGRVGLSIASGWVYNDFLALAPKNYQERHKLMYEGIGEVKRLWSGEKVLVDNPNGDKVELSVYPKPIQKELPIWVTAAQHPDTFKSAGKIGANVLTHLIGQTPEDLKAKIDLYREEWKKAGHEGEGSVALMIHTFLGEDREKVKEIVREPFKNYLGSSIGLIKTLAKSFGRDIDEEGYSKEDIDALLEHAFNRYFENSSLMGTPESCLNVVNELSHFGVDEFACLVDFGIESEHVIKGYESINKLKELYENQLSENKEESITELIEKHKVTHMQCTPSLMKMIWGEDNAKVKSTSLKKVFLGGEAVPLNLVKKLQSDWDVTVYNMYGPTETTIWSAVNKIPDGIKKMTVGKPIANTEIYVLDQSLQLVPVGVEGDVYIGGKGVTLGYFNRPDLTEERFLTNPFANDKLIYKTGDKGVWSEQGELEIRGREDDQLKVRGYRIEPGEIEARLTSFKGVNEAVVTAYENEHHDKELVAYFVGDGEFNSSELSAFLKEILPVYMVPSYFVKLDEMPLTPNGKISKRHLPSPHGISIDTGVELIEPNTEIEKELVEIWKNLFGREDIGIKHNFFELGGHSLLATKLLGIYHQSFNSKLQLKDLFLFTTIESHASLISQSEKVGFGHIDKIEIQENYPLSNAQRRLWVLSQMKEISVSYNEPTKIPLIGKYEFKNLKRSIEAVIDRHEILRTVFKTDSNGEIKQWVLNREEIGVEIDVLDLTKEESPEEKMEAYIQEDINTQFDMEHGPLFSVCVFQLKEEEYLFYYNMHHIISDGRSKEIMARDVLAFYRAFEENTKPELPELRIQYNDFATWQIDRLNSEELLEDENYWISQFSNDLPILDLPISKKRPPLRTIQGRRLRTLFSKSLSAQVKAFSSAQNGTLFMTLLAATKAVLYRYSQQSDFIIGSPVAGREHGDLEDQIGVYINMLALRSKIDKNDSFQTLFQQVKETAIQGFNHQEYPFDYLVEKLDLKADTSRNALFDVILILHNAIENAKASEPGIFTDLGNVHSKYDLELSFQEFGEQISFMIDYNEDLYARNDVERFMSHFISLLSTSIEKQDEKLSTLTWLNQVERTQLLNEFNSDIDKSVKLPNVINLIEERAIEQPNSLAVISDGVEISYHELSKKSSAFAAYLTQTFSVRSGDLVGIKLKRDANLPIALLGTLKAGAGYVPLDLEYPDQRINYIIENSGVETIIDAESWADFLEKENEFTELYDAANNLESTAYIIYTSGSTGKPKGVEISHHNLAAFVNWATEEFSATNFDIVYASTSICFDLSIFELFYPLTAGKTVRLVENGLAIKDYLDQDENVLLNTVPSTITALIDSETEWSTVNAINLAGEPIPKYCLENLELDRIEVRNLYGPSESTTYSTFTKINDAENVTIGRPIKNTKIHILDENNQLLPIGVAGEICISGLGLAKGYLNNEELTTEKFLENPFNPIERLYKTGDIGKWLPDGNIQFTGRKDDQVKVRGYRIELGEIETVLVQLEGITDSLVVIREEENSVKSIVAYCIIDETAQIANIREILGEVLPKYMVPHFVVRLTEFPRTLNGKIDRKKLPEPQAQRVSEKKAKLATTAKEIALIAACEEVLKVDRLSMQDNFYDLGGDSIKSIQVISLLRQKGYTLQVDEVFRYPQFENLARKMKLALRTIDQSPVEGIVPVTPIQRAFFQENLLPVKSHYNHSVLLKSRESLSVPDLTKALDKLVRHHDALRISFTKESNKWTQQNNKQQFKGYDLSVHDLVNSKDSLAETKLITDEIQAGFNLEEGGLMKVGVMQLPEEDRILIVVHHLVVDGISWRIILEDLATLYNQSINKEKLKLPLKTDSFMTWGKFLASYSNSPALLNQKTYWLDQLKQETKEFPTDFAKDEKGVSSVQFELGQKVVNDLLYNANRAFSTQINEILLTALGKAVRNTFDVNRFYVQMEGHGREPLSNQIDCSRTVGWFTSLYPFLIENKDSNGDFETLVATKEALRAIPDNGVGYGVLNYLGEEKLPAVTPAITFNYLGDFSNTLTSSSNETEAPFTFSEGYSGNNLSEENSAFTTPLSVQGMIVNEEMSMTIAFREGYFSKSTIESLADNYQNELENLIGNLSAEKETRLTPADLTSNNLSLSELQKNDLDKNAADIYNLAPLQEGIFFHWLSGIDPETYFQQIAYRIVGASLDLELIEKSYALLLDKYPILRTSFTNELGNENLQIVWKKVENSYTQITVPADLDEKDKNEFITQVKKEDRLKGFDLLNGSQMRLTVIDLMDGSYEFIWSSHHIIMDGWCISILVNDFYKIFTNLQQQISPEKFDIIPFSDYIKWLNKLDKQLSLQFWKGYLDGYENEVKVPFRKEIIEQGYSVEKESIYISGEQLDLVKKSCAENNITENTFIQSAWGYLLSRYSNVEDVVFGAVVSGRPPEIDGIEVMVGLFINTIPVRISYNKDAKVKDLIKSAQTGAINALPHHFLNLSDVQSQSQLGMNLVNHLMVFENYVVQEMEDLSEGSSEDMKIEGINVHEQNNYDFNVDVIPSDEGIRIDLSFNEYVYDSKGIQQLKSQLETVIAAFATDVNKQLSDIKLINKEQEDWIVKEINSTKTEYPREESIVTLFSNQVQLTPEKTALVFKDKKYSYQELDALTNKLANCLIQDYGLAKGDRIGIMLERGPWMVISELAILKARAVFVPLDLEHPSSRKNYILENASVDFLLTETNFIFDIDYFEGTIFAVDVEFSADQYDANLPDLNFNVEDEVYIMFTSGSTGKPKGVIVTNRNVVRLVKATNYVDFEVENKLLSTGAFAFDATTFEYWGMLLNGGELYLCEKAVMLDVDLLAEEINKHQINIMWMTSGWFNQLVDLRIDLFKNIREIVTGGDKISPFHVNKLKAEYPRINVKNVYGPTENTTFSLFHEVLGGEEEIPVGKPIANSTAYIVDDHLNLLPIGVPGEIALGGDGVAHSYLGDSELTDSKFVNLNGERVYLTGDIGAWNSEGNIRFIGRKDDQVKIRGYRIELGAIETAIRGVDGVENVAINVLGSLSEEKKLVAYYTGKNEISFQASLEQKLPKYMVPDHIIWLEQFPITLNGKIDKKALPIPDVVAGTKSVEYIEPKGEIELRVAEIWVDLLEQERIGLKDDFFELGGHSLKAMRLISEYHKSFNVRLALKDLFAQTVLEEHVNLIEGGTKSKFETIDKAVEADYYAVSSSQKRLWLIDQLDPGTTAYNMFGTYSLPSNFALEHFEKAVNQLIARHEILRTVFIEEDGVPYQKVLNSDEVYLNILTGSESDYPAASIAHYRFDLSKWSLLKMVVVKGEGKSPRLLFCMHHIISDGWSMELFIRDLLALYESMVEDTAVSLPALSIQYKDYAVWQNKQLSNGYLSSSQTYWQNQLGGRLPQLRLPEDYATSRPSLDGSSYELFINQELKNRIEAFIQSEKVSLFSLLLSSFKVMLHRLTAEEDLIVGTPVANRSHESVKDLIGFFLNTLMIRNKVDSEEAFRSFLQQVNQTLITGLEHQSYPFENLLDDLDVVRDYNRFPISSVFLNMIDFNSTEKVTINELAPKHEQSSTAAKFDMECYFKSYSNAISIYCIYKKDLFKADTIAYWMNNFLSVIDQVVTNPDLALKSIAQFDSPLNKLDYPKPAQAHTFFAKEKETTLIARFEKQAEEYANNPAIVSSTKTLTYQELNAYGNGIAHLIQEQEQSSAPIALLAEHGWLTVGSMLGALKSGHSYLPLDPSFPEDRLKYMLEDTNSKLLLATPATLELANRLKDDTVQVILLNESIQSKEENPMNELTGESPAYILYTSGSTGKPKGVVQNHKNVLYFISVYTNGLHLTPEDRLSLLPTYGFDAAVMDIYGGLLNGSALYPYHVKTEGLKGLNNWLEEEQITVLHMVPTLYRYFLEDRASNEQLKDIRLVVLGGEAVYQSDFELFKTHFTPGCIFINGYGPTESTITLQNYMNHNSEVDNQKINIGYPVADTTVYVLDENDKPLGIYQEGELVYKSNHLAIGYHNKTDQTAIAFTDDPVTREGRVYRSGDLGRLLPSGEVEFTGRKDSQVKLNGQRIELSEIEQALLKINAVEEAIVLLKSDGEVDRLVSYIKTTTKEAELRQALSLALPMYMVPTIYVYVDVFPLTPTGKISRRDLPEPDFTQIATAEYVAPRNEVEQQLVDIWQEVLNKDQIGVHDNFFDLGGHSLKAIQLLSRINKEFEVIIDLTGLFANPTIETVATEIEKINWVNDSATESDELNDTEVFSI